MDAQKPLKQRKRNQTAKPTRAAKPPKKAKPLSPSRYTRSPNVDPSCPLDSILLRIAANPRADRQCREWAERLLSTEAAKVVFVAGGKKTTEAGPLANGPG
jgi:hypothetical protein